MNTIVLLFSKVLPTKGRWDQLPLKNTDAYQRSLLKREHNRTHKTDWTWDVGQRIGCHDESAVACGWAWLKLVVHAGADSDRNSVWDQWRTLP
ncbi:MAG: hypothetical protein ACKPKO_00245, partial [Candidatus Fonsibacter sp.]